MKMLCSAWLFACLMLGAGCAYLGDRSRDFGDMFTLAVEENTFGLVVRALVPGGISRADGSGCGLREGYLGRYDYKEDVLTLMNGDDSFTLFDLEFRPLHDARNKHYRLGEGDLFYELDDFKYGGYQGQYRLWREGLNVQASVGVYYGVRAGINVPEVLDFILGWATLDIAEDDSGTHQREGP